VPGTGTELRNHSLHNRRIGPLGGLWGPSADTIYNGVFRKTERAIIPMPAGVLKDQVAGHDLQYAQYMSRALRSNEKGNEFIKDEILLTGASGSRFLSAGGFFPG
jgi:hypothetical protein